MITGNTEVTNVMSNTEADQAPPYRTHKGRSGPDWKGLRRPRKQVVLIDPGFRRISGGRTINAYGRQFGQ
jgi:hypothetical protein